MVDTTNTSSVTINIDTSTGVATAFPAVTMQGAASIATFSGPYALDRRQLHPRRHRCSAEAAAKSNKFTVSPDTASGGYSSFITASTVVGVPLAPNLVVEIQDQFGNIITTDHSKVTLSLAAPGPGTLGGTTTVTVGKGIATFSGLMPWIAGSFTLVATDALTAAKSNKFTVSPDTASGRLFLHPQATGTVVGVPLRPSTSMSKIEDQFGNTITTDHPKVTLSLAAPAPAPSAASTTVTVSQRRHRHLQQAPPCPPSAATPSTPSTIRCSPITPPSSPRPSRKASRPSPPPIPPAPIRPTTPSPSPPPSNPQPPPASPSPAPPPTSIKAAMSQVWQPPVSAANGSIKFTLNNLAANTYTCTLIYLGDTNHTPITSSSFPLAPARQTVGFV